jgi:hypothetical protein
MGIKLWIKKASRSQKMKINVFFRTLTVLTLLGSVKPLIWADLASDSQKSAEWFSEELGELMAFQAASTHFLPGNTVGFPGGEIGIAGGISAKTLDVGRFRSFTFTELDNKSSEIDLPNKIGAPVGVLHAKVGLPGGWDLGLKAGSASFDRSDDDAKIDFSNKIVGVEVRKLLLGDGLAGAALPDLSVSVGFDRATGDLTRTERYSGNALSGGTLTANTTWKSEWSVGAVSARAVASKNFLIITPFIGAGVTKLTGDTDTTVLVDVTGGSSGLADAAAKGTAKAKKTLGHAILGFELSPLPFFRLNVSGLVAKDHWAGSLGLRAEFP